MRILEKLEPNSVFSYFEDLCQIPHGSGNTKAISDYCVEFAKAHGLSYVQDEVNNVIIYKPASAGYESAPTVIIQGHLDMVAEKELGSDFDFTKDPLKLKIDGNFVRAEGTTLGGDDGIAVAMALAVLADDTIAHPAIEALFTIDEETGMDGAAALDGSLLKGRLLLNIDSEEEGILTVSCAGGCRANCVMAVETEPYAGTVCTLSIEGLAGGHSGAEIHKERGNSNLLMGRLLTHLRRSFDLRLVSVKGGLKDNAIPLATEAILAVKAEDVSALQAAAAAFASVLQAEYAISDPNVKITFAANGSAEAAMTAASTDAVIDFLSLVPNGVAAMSMDIEGLVQTSCNLGVFSADASGLHAGISVRSSVASQKQMLLDRIEALTVRLGGSVTITGDYPAWEYRRESVLRDVMVDSFRSLFGHEPKVEAIHAGLECGLLSGKLPGLDAVSFGPDMFDIHTTRERMDIASIQRTWEYLLDILKRLK
ncbi:MAG: aminoacyl-histidine dipeptidase [Oscillospiraceae bacterium]|nr:aminoacyl-histidine dipeptidase [Oscillospiraceae bacterium]